MERESETAPIEHHKLRAFVSYSRDDRPAALPIIAALEAEGFEVWWDGLLEGGDAFAHATETALETADAVVVLWSAISIQSHWVRDEATRGRDRGCMVPVTLDGTMPPLGFRQIQVVDLAGWKGTAADAKFAVLAKAIRATATAPRNQLRFTGAAASAPVTTRRRALMLAGGGALTVAGGLAAWSGGLFSRAATANSVAVLPFRNLGDPSQDYFADGLADELRAILSRNRQVEVMGETSSDSFRGNRPDVKAIAAALRVALILDGSVRTAGDAMRITAQLIDGATGFTRWSQTFDRKRTDILAVQSDIATMVADAMIANISAEPGFDAHRIGGTQNARAYDAFLRGSALTKQAANEASDRGALARYDEAIGLDPKFAAAHAARSGALTVIAGTYARSDQVKDYLKQAIAAANTAIALAPDLALGHFALGYALFNGMLDIKAAEAPYAKCFELGYGSAGLLAAFGEYAANIGNFADGRKAFARAQRLDPLNSVVFRGAGVLEFLARQPEAAKAALRSALSFNAKGGIVHRILGDIELAQGRFREARQHYEQEPFEILRLPGLAIADMRLSGEQAGARQMAELVQKYGDNSFYQQVEILAQWGRQEEALAALEKAFALSDPGLALLRNDPLLDPIRHSPRFVTILNALGFT